MSGLFDAFFDLLVDGGSAILNLIIENRQEKRDLQALMVQQREEHATIVRQMATRGKSRSFRGFDLTGATLDNLDLAAVDLTEASFRNAQVFQTDFQEADLTGADFSGAYLVDINFARANLSQADFTEAILQNVDFSQANLRGAELSLTKELIGCTWNGAYINSKTELVQEIRSNIFDSL
ncbi:MAG: pentapeptide repeat-containing protein [Anaerolineaceae bacterium]|nr:pentapeptide repeat-containing protein [Anaerolineaceae bacterium]